jgi:hypothetical protein
LTASTVVLKLDGNQQQQHRGTMGAIPDAYRQALIQMDGFVARLSLWALACGGGGRDERRPVPVRPVDAARLLGVTANTARNHWDRWQDLWLDTGDGWVPNTAAWPDAGKWWHRVSPTAALRLGRLSWPCAQVAIYLLGPLRKRRYAQDPAMRVTVRALARRLGRSTATISAALRELESAQIITRIAPGPGRETRISTGSWLAAPDDSNSDTDGSNFDTDSSNFDTKNAEVDTLKRKTEHTTTIRNSYTDNRYNARTHRGMGIDLGDALMRDPLFTADQLLENAQTFTFQQPLEEKTDE